MQKNVRMPRVCAACMKSGETESRLFKLKYPVAGSLDQKKCYDGMGSSPLFNTSALVNHPPFNYKWTNDFTLMYDHL